MAGPASGVEVESSVVEVVERLRAGTARSLEPSEVARLVALGDERVEAKILERISRGYLVRGTSWLPPRRVLWQFDCAPGAEPLAPVGFVVVVDLEAGIVVEVVDPYDPEVEGGPAESAAPEGWRAEVRG